MKGLAVILKRMNKSDVTIAVDGSLFRYHPRLQVMLEATLKNLINPLNKVYFILSKSFKEPFLGLYLAKNQSYLGDPMCILYKK